MNLFLRELKSHRFALIFWSLGMIALIGASMAKYAAYSSTGQSIGTIVNQFPKTLQVVFGLNGFNLATTRGFFGVIFIYIAIMATIHAVLLGSDIIAKEERERTSEFLYVKPLSRHQAITAKLIAGLINLIILNLVTFVSSIYFIHLFAKGHSINKDIFILMVGLFFLQLIFYSLGALIAGVSRKPKAAAALSTSILMVTFILSFLINFSSSLDFLKYLTPFKYFDARDILAHDHLDPFYVVLTVIIVVLMIYGTYYFYNERDLKV